MSARLLALFRIVSISTLAVAFAACTGSDETPVASPDATGTASPEATPTAEDAQIEERVQSAYDAVRGSVVNVTSQSYTSNRFLGEVPSEGSGSGFVYDEQGHIVTNYHVIGGADSLIVTLPSGESFDATVVGTDPPDDLAVLRINAGDSLPPPIEVADAESMRVGQFVMAVGHPFGLGQTLTTGVISGLGRVISGATAESFIGEAIQTDASINPGNSGGPLLDLDGQVIGINSQILSPSGASAGVGFAISASTVNRVVPQLISTGSYTHPWLGVQGSEITPFVAGLLRDAGVTLPVDTGLLVTGLDAGSPADEADLQPVSQTVRVGPYRLPANGDVITALNGEQVSTLQEIIIYLEAETAIGDTVDITLYRDGEEMTVPVTITEKPEQQIQPQPQQQGGQ